MCAIIPHPPQIPITCFATASTLAYLPQIGLARQAHASATAAAEPIGSDSCHFDIPNCNGGRRGSGATGFGRGRPHWVDVGRPTESPGAFCRGNVSAFGAAMSQQYAIVRPHCHGNVSALGTALPRQCVRVMGRIDTTMCPRLEPHCHANVPRKVDDSREASRR